MEGCASTELAIVLIHTQDMPVLKKSVSIVTALFGDCSVVAMQD